MTKNQEVLGWIGTIYTFFGVAFLILGLVFGFGNFETGTELMITLNLGSAILLIFEGWLLKRAAADSSKTTILFILALIGVILQVINLFTNGFTQFFNGLNGIIALFDLIFDVVLFVLVWRVRKGR